MAYYSPYAQYQAFYVFNNGPIQLAGTNFCLDAGINPSNGSGLKLWDCYSMLLQQTWSFSTDGLVSLSNSKYSSRHEHLAHAVDQCLDVQLGSQPGGQEPYTSIMNLQTWTCSDPDPQQHFTVG